MPESYQPTEEYYGDAQTRLKDIEEKQRLLRDRVLLIGKNIVEDRESMIKEIDEIKKLLAKTREENIKIQDFLKKVADQLSESARKEEIMILQRQLDLFMTARGRK
jgi:tRNA G18 (ribose-2'-O)-methylase SpoU